MTDKQFVKSVCPTARLRNTIISKTVFWYIDIRATETFWPKKISDDFIVKGEAWKNAAEKMRMDMLRQLEI
jgi:hypothetical protein